MLLKTNLSLLIEDEEGLYRGVGQQGLLDRIVSPNVLISSLGKRDVDCLVPRLGQEGGFYL